jgi:hypothetical protein
MYMASKADNNDMDELQKLLKEYRAAKEEEEAIQQKKAELPPMLRQESAPLWDEMLNTGDPYKLGDELEKGEITYEQAVKQARERYLEKQNKGGGKKRKSRRKRRKRKRKTKKRRRRKKRKTKKRYINQRGCSRKR